MNASPLELRALRLADERSFMDAVDEFRQDDPWDFALGFDESMSFSEYVLKNDQWARGEALPVGFVPASFLVGVVDSIIVGRLSLRHELNEFLSKIGGHIGYGVRPSHRRRGYATAMLTQSLPLAAKVGIKRALLTCDVENTGSRLVIERCGGVLESVTSDPSLEIQKRRYWISTG
jgi:predicted acetyltransferase